jgi:hypothetical protein
MANVESTGFTKLVRDLTRRPVARDSDDDVLFTNPDAGPRTARAFEVVLPKSLDDAVTLRVRRQPTRFELVKLALPFGLLAVLGVLIGLAITTKSKRDEPAQTASASATLPAATPTATPAGAPAPSAPTTTPAAPAAPTAPSPAPSAAPPAPASTSTPAPTTPLKLVDVRLESTPPGANVTMVDDGKVSVLGRTPIDASLDPSRGYEIVFALDAHATKVEHVDPSKTANVAVVLDALPAKPARTSHATRHRTTKRH